MSTTLFSLWFQVVRWCLTLELNPDLLFFRQTCWDHPHPSSIIWYLRSDSNRHCEDFKSPDSTFGLRRHWYSRSDSNRHCTGFESVASYLWATRAYIRKWMGKVDSNHYHQIQSLRSLPLDDSPIKNGAPGTDSNLHLVITKDLWLTGYHYGGIIIKFNHMAAPIGFDPIFPISETGVLPITPQGKTCILFIQKLSLSL